MSSPVILVLGAGGIIGQHMQIICPEALFARRRDVDLESRVETDRFLDSVQPNVIVNLAGENRVNVVAGHPQATVNINVGLPRGLASWCDEHHAHLVQVSSQGVFSGDHAPYHPNDVPHPQTEYGAQKAEAERLVAGFTNWTIARVTFVLGVRPLDIGRVNPLEEMFEQDEQAQVNDRFFSPSFAIDVAHGLTFLAGIRPAGQILHLGLPIRVSRYDIARIANPKATIRPVSDASFSGPSRPLDTSYTRLSLHIQGLAEGIAEARKQWENKHVSS